MGKRISNIFSDRKIASILAVFVIVIISIGVWFINASKNAPEAEAGWYDESWLYRRQFVVDNTKIDEDLTDFPVAVQFISTGSNPYSNTNSDGSDLRFTDNQGNLLKYEIESWNESGTSTVWVKLPKVYQNTDTNFYMYYGNASAQDAQEPEEVWDDNFKMVQHLQEGDSPSVVDFYKDSTTNNNDALLTDSDGDSSSDYGQLDGAIRFSGDSDYISTDFDPAYQQITVSAWVKSDVGAAGVTDDIVSYWEYVDFCVTGCSWVLTHHSNNQYFWEVDDETNISGGTVSTNWTHVVGVYNGSTGYLRLYVNGTEVNSSSGNFGTLNKVDADVIIGSQYDLSNFFDGIIDEVRISNTERSAAWLNAEYYNGNGTLLTDNGEEQGPGPLAYWSFDEGYGQVVYDRGASKTEGMIGSTSGSDTNDPTWVSSEYCMKGNCLKFDGNDDYVNFGSSNAIKSNSGSFTFSLWSRGFGYQDGVSSSDGGHGGWMGSSGNRGVAFGPDDGGDSNFWVPTNATTLVAMSTLNVNDEDGWIHWAYVYDADNQLMIMYRNGTEVNRNDSGDGVPTSIYTGNNVTVKIGDRGDGLVNWDGYIDEVRYYNYVRTPAEIKKEMNQAKSASFGGSSSGLGSLTDGLVGYWPMDESASSTCVTTNYDTCDQGQFNLDGNWIAGTDATSTAKFGRAIELNGSTDYVEIDDSVELDISKSITLAAWVNFRSTNSWDNIIGKRESTNRAYQLERHSTNNTYLFELTGVGSIDSATTIATGEWHHVVGTWDDDTNRLAIYVDGVLERHQDMGENAAMITNNSPVNIGRSGSAGLYYLDGLVDEARIYNRALSPEEVRHLYEWAPGPVAYWKMDEKEGQNVYDSSGSENVGSFGDNAADESDDPEWASNCVYGSCVKFTKSDNDEISFPDDVSLNQSDNFSVMGWFKFNAFSTDSALFSFDDSGSRVFIEIDNSAYQLQLYDTTGDTAYTANTSLSPNTWYHFAVTKQGNSGNNVKFYINGRQDGTASVGNLPDPSGGSKDIGYNAISNDGFDGWIDEVKVYDYARSARQIAEDMYAGNQNKPLAYWSFDDGRGTILTDDAATSVSHNGTLINMTTSGTSSVWTVNGKKGGAIEFTGVDNEHIDLSGESDLRLSSYSISAWILPRQLDTYSGSDRATIISKWNGSGGTQVNYDVAINSSRKIYVRQSNSTTYSYTSNKTIQEDIWQHIVVTYDEDSSQLALYIDGELDKVQTSSIQPYTGTSANPHIGAFNFAWPDAAYEDEFIGMIDEVKLYPYPLSFDEIRQEYNTGVQTVLSKTRENLSESTQGLVGWWKMDEPSWSGNAGQVIDYSGAGNHGTPTNAVSTSTAKYGRAGYFDGTGDYVSFASNPLTGENMTISTWIKADSYSGTQTIANSILDSNNRYWFYVAANDLTFFSEIGNVTTASVVTNGNYLTDGQWHFVSAVVEGNKGIRIYVDGIDRTDTVNTFVANADYGFGGSTYFGAYNGSSSLLTGILDDVKIYNTIRTSDQIMTDYVEGPPSMGWWRLDEKQGSSIKDYSGFGSTGTASGGPTWERGISGSSLKFDGVDDTVNFGDIDLYDFGTDNFSITAWMKLGPNFAAYKDIISKRGAGVPYWTFVTFPGQTMRFEPRDSDGTDKADLAFGVMPTEEWFHIAVSADRKGNIVGYVNGQEIDSTSMDNLGSLSSSEAFQFLKSTTLADYAFIDDVKIFNYALTPRQVAMEYNNGRSVGYWGFDEGEGTTVYDSSGNKNHGSLVIGSGGTQAATTSAWTNGASGKINGSLNFDGTDDYVNLGSGSALDVSPPISVGAWVKPDTFSGQSIFYFTSKFTDDDGSGDQGWAFGYVGTHTSCNSLDGAPFVYETATNGTVCSSVPMTAGTWHYLVFTNDGSTTRVYINGDEVGSGSQTIVEAASSNLTVGRRSDDILPTSGQVDEVKIWNYQLTPEEIRREYTGGAVRFR